MRYRAWFFFPSNCALVPVAKDKELYYASHWLIPSITNDFIIEKATMYRNSHTWTQPECV